ncbi:Spy/CpxP family protein refolding chaperone, partial [Burkholderia metallica]
MKKISLTLATLAVAASAFAQTPAPQASAPAATAAASAPSAEQRAARHEARIEQRIKYLHDQLKITSAQEPQWKTFADTMRENG